MALHAVIAPNCFYSLSLLFLRNLEGPMFGIDNLFLSMAANSAISQQSRPCLAFSEDMDCEYGD